MKRPTVQHRLEYLALLGVGGVLRALPDRMESRFAEALGGFAGGVLKFRRDVVDRNLMIAFPDRSPVERQRIAVASYRHLVREGEHLLSAAIRPGGSSDIRDRTYLADTESEEVFAFLEQLSAARKPAIALTGHLGNWEMMGAAMSAHGVPIRAVAVAQRNPLFDARVLRMREMLGLHIISRDEAGRAIPRALAEGRVVGLVADQYSQRGVAVDFFGRSVKAARGPAVFALRSGAPAVVGVAIRDPVWPPRYAIHLRRFEMVRTGSIGEDIVRWTAAYMSALEGYVRRFPEQYLWLHKRWRDTAPGAVRG